MRAPSCAGRINGSSPCTLMIISLSVSALSRPAVQMSYASRTRSVPHTWSLRVITAFLPASSTQFRIRSSSVATIGSMPASVTRSVTRSITSRPPSLARGLPGKRDEAYRAGIIARYLFFIFIALFLFGKTVFQPSGHQYGADDKVDII
jgi:hypothetical protein